MVINPKVGATYYYVNGKRLIQLTVDNHYYSVWCRTDMMSGRTHRGTYIDSKDPKDVFETPAEALADGVQRAQKALTALRSKVAKCDDKLGTLDLHWAEASGNPISGSGPQPVKIMFEGKTGLLIEDGVCALSLQVADEATPDNLFAQITHWDADPNASHEEIRALAGKRLRVTFEEVTD